MAHRVLPLGMRIILVFLIVVVVAGGVLTYNRREKPAAPGQKTTTATSQASPTRDPSKHNWPKSALDRAAEVKQQVAEQRKANKAEPEE